MNNLKIFVAICICFCGCVTTNQTHLGSSALKNEQILFSSKRDGNFEVYVMNDDSTLVMRLTNNLKTDYALNWSPDGNFILFYSDRSGNEEIWRMKADGTDAINLTNAPSNERSACYSPDGKKIVFISDRDNLTQDLYLMNADGSNTKRITFNKTYCESPVWSNDGKQILFTTEVKSNKDDKSGNGEIVIVQADGSNQQRLTKRVGFDSGADVSPDGKQVAFYGKSATGKSDIFIMNLDGSDVINVTNDDAEDYSPSWSANGSWLAYTSGSAANYDIWKINVRTKEKVRLTSQLKRDETPYYKPILK